MIQHKICRICSKKVIGRSDKQFCSLRCKNYYHVNLRKVTTQATAQIDEILHRNRSVLLELLGKTGKKIIIDRTALEKRNFSFTYHTHTHVNIQGKKLHWVYDLGWMAFSNHKVLILRN